MMGIKPSFTIRATSCVSVTPSNRRTVAYIALDYLPPNPLQLKQIIAFHYKKSMIALPEVRRQLPRTPLRRSWLGRGFVARSNGYIRGIVLLGKEDTRMYWYNPATRTSERVQAPSTDEQAAQMLAGTPDSAEFIGEYLELRRSGSPIEQALVLVGHEFRLREPEHQLILR